MKDNSLLQSDVDLVPVDWSKITFNSVNVDPGYGKILVYFYFSTVFICVLNVLLSRLSRDLLFYGNDCQLLLPRLDQVQNISNTLLKPWRKVLTV